MVLKLFRVMWFLSVLVVLADLLYVYASLPEAVVVRETDSTPVGRELLFYILLGCIVGVNFLVYLLKMFFHEAEALRAWFHGFVITINIFAIISMHTISVYNSGEIFDYSRVGILLTGSIGLILAWALSWPLYWVFQKFFVKQSV